MGQVIGVAGCGTMGLSMALQMQGHGLDVWGYDVRPADQFGDFAPRMITDRTAFASRCDVVLSMVLNMDQIEDLCFGEAGLFTGDNPPTTLIVSSTISPRALPVLKERLPMGTVLVDAAVSGSHIAAETGTLTFMLGGDDADIAALMPFFEAMGKSIHHAGPLGAGMTCKVANNYVVAATLLAVRKGIRVAGARGVDEKVLRDILAAGSGDTWYGRSIDTIAWARVGYADDVPDNGLPLLDKDVRAFIDGMADIPGQAPGQLEDAMLEALRAEKALP